MKEKTPTYSELLEERKEQERNDKFFRTLNSFFGWAIMIAILSVIYELAIVGLGTILAVSGYIDQWGGLCFSFLQVGVFVLGVYITWHLALALLINYQDELEEIVERWEAFREFNKRKSEGDL
jgi:hypothetical protein